MRTGGGSRVLAGVQRAHMASVDTGNAVDGLGKVVPRDNTLVAEVINAWHDALIDGGKDGHSQVASVSRCTYLVEDNTQLGLLLTQTNHRLYKVIAECRVQPCRADNHRALATIGYLLLAFQLGATVSAVRTYTFVLGIRAVIGTVEHIVGRNLNHPSTTLLDGFGQQSWGGGVQLVAQLLVLLSLVHGCVGGAVHNAVNLVVSYKSVDGFLVGNIQLSHIRIKIGMLLVFLFQQLHLVS